MRLNLSVDEYKEYQAYKATGLSPKEIVDLKQGLLPDDEDRAPLPPLTSWVPGTSAAMGLLEED